MEQKEEKLSPKVEALYKAVMELLLEGREVRQLKVSEITERAGIGKGTAYEYFESREELLVDAMKYVQKTWVVNIWEGLSHYDSFMGKISCLFDMLDDIMKKISREALMEICKILFLSPVVRKEKGCMARGLYDIVETGRRGGELKEELPDEYVVLTLMGKIFGYIFYSAGAKDAESNVCEPAQMKTYLLDSVRTEFLAKR